MRKRAVMKWIVLGVAVGIVACSDEPEKSIPGSVSIETYRDWIQEISNWGRWGDTDQLGTLNLITPAKRLAALRLVREGVTVSMALDLNTQADDVNENPFMHEREFGEFGGHQVGGDSYSVSYHGFAHSHIDGLLHFAHDGRFYNGFSFDEAKQGSNDLGIHNAKDGIVTRGVLIDMARFKGVEYLEPGTAITVEDLEAWENETGVRVESGDVVLLRTGRWTAVRDLGQDLVSDRFAGLHVSVAMWLKARDVAAIGCDGVSDVIPGHVEGLANPLHELVIVALGMPIFDNLDLDAVAEAARERSRWEFLFFGGPLRVRGGTGSPLNPIAMF